MHIAVIGLNHNTAPVEIRERLAVSTRQIPETLQRLRNHPDIAECVLVSTCNRTEAYAALMNSGDKAVAMELASISQLTPTELAEYLYMHFDTSAATHLFRVASGVDSMIVGESQVLGQVRGAFEAAQASGSVGSLLNRLFETALATGKKVQTETDINKGSLSVGSAAVDLAKSIFGDLSGRRVLLLGAGTMSEIVADRLKKNGAASVIVANRTHERARELAEKFGGRAVHYDEFMPQMEKADIVITSTGSPHFVVRREPMEQIMLHRNMRPIFLIDIAVPRDVDPAVSELDCVFLYDIDDLNSIVAETARERQAEVERAERIIDHEAEQFTKWQKSLVAAPVIRGLTGRLERIAGEEMNRYESRLRHLSDKDRSVVSEMMRSFVNKIVHHPISHIKDYASNGGEDRLQTVVEVFGIDHEIDEADWRGDGI